MTAERLRGSIELVAHHSHFLVSLLQSAQQIHDAGIRLGGVEVVLHIMLSEVGIGLVEERIAVALRNGTLHELANAVAHKSPDVVDRVLLHPVGAKSVVAARSQIVECGEQRAVQVEDIRIIFPYSFFIILCFHHFSVIELCKVTSILSK